MTKSAAKKKPAAAAAPARFVKKTIKGDVVILEPARGLMWDPGEQRVSSQQEAEDYVKSLRTGGFTDWQLAEVKPLFLLADRTKKSPAIDTRFFPNCKSDWYWSRTPAAYSPADYAWNVNFSSGVAVWYGRGNGGFVRAVRASQ